MTATDLLDMRRELGVGLEAAGGHLRYRPASAVPAELREALAVHKSEVLRLLAYQAAVCAYELLGAQVDGLTGRAVAARERGDVAAAARPPTKRSQRETSADRVFETGARLKVRGTRSSRRGRGGSTWRHPSRPSVKG